MFENDAAAELNAASDAPIVFIIFLERGKPEYPDASLPRTERMRRFQKATAAAKAPLIARMEADGLRVTSAMPGTMCVVVKGNADQWINARAYLQADGIKVVKNSTLHILKSSSQEVSAQSASVE